MPREHPRAGHIFKKFLLKNVRRTFNVGGKNEGTVVTEGFPKSALSHWAMENRSEELK